MFSNSLMIILICPKVKRGEVEEEDSEEEDAPDPDAGLTRRKVVKLVQ